MGLSNKKLFGLIVGYVSFGLLAILFGFLAFIEDTWNLNKITFFCLLLLFGLLSVISLAVLYFELSWRRRQRGEED